MTLQHRIRVRTFTALMTLIMLLTQGCVPVDFIVGTHDMNEHTRLDRQPLTTEQRPDVIDTVDLYDGTYRTNADQIISDIYPAGMDDVIASLPQSDCIWLGRDGAQGEALRLHWELVSRLSDEAIDEFDLSDEVREIGLCRFNDVVTRQPPRRENGSDEYIEMSARDVQKYGDDGFSIDGENFPRLTEDINLHWGQLREFPTRDSGPLNSCETESSNDPAEAVDIFSGVLGYDGSDGAPYNDDQPHRRISACSGPFGRILFPERDARYEYWDYADEYGPEVSRFFSASIKIAHPGAGFARPTSASGSQHAWSTMRTGTDAEDTYWEENFSRRIQPTEVRFFTENEGIRNYLDLDGSRLCINDPANGMSCDWRCDAEDTANGSRFVILADSSMQPGCRIGEALNGLPELPPVTPTYRRVALCDRNEANCAPILDPLIWSIDGVDPGIGTVYIEFTLEPVFEGMALRAAPTSVPLGSLEIGRKSQAAVEVQNIGGVPLEVDLISAIAHPDSDAVFQAIALGSPQPFPLPVRDSDGALALVLDDEFFAPYKLSQGEGYTMLRETLVDSEAVEIQGHMVAVNGRVLIRPSEEVSLADPALDPSEYPVNRMSYALRSVPFVLQPDERAEVLVSARPTGYYGLNSDNLHLGWLRVEASNVLDPNERQSAEIPITIRALNGPHISALPQSIALPLAGVDGGASHRGVTIIANEGDVGVDLESILIHGDDAVLFSLHQPPALPHTLEPGAAVVLEVDYQTNCDVQAIFGHHAQLQVETSHQVAQISLNGTSECMLALP